MKLRKFKYYEPQGLEEALSLLDRFGHVAAILAGGTDLVPLMKQKTVQAKHLINIKHLTELDFIRGDSMLEIGALTTIRGIEKSDFLQKKCPLLRDTAGRIGYVQIRNVGTIGGNICNASPAADFAPALMVLDATVEIASVDGKKSASINSFFLNPGETILDKNEMITRFWIPRTDEGTRCIFRKVPSGNSSGLAIASVAVLSSVDKVSGVVREARIAVGSMAPTPIRCFKTEKLLVGEKISDEILNIASQKIVEETKPISDIRGSREYRIHLIKVMTKDALMDIYWRNLS
ncbi:MAG: xanthine dehydrogenase family protein subunit M [Deltaproteobacteria bacterium]|nr:xanthine dehydrogenase family protein subunit M [Deltaproteobacteria bacterium]